MRYQFYFLIVIAGWALARPTEAADKVTYQDNVRPILREHCFACHNQDEATASLALDSFDGLITGGAGGEVIAAGDLDGSRLWKLVTHQEEPKMPPGDQLPQEKLDVLRAWIEGGLLKDNGSKPLRSKKPTIAKLDAEKLGKPDGEPAMPEQLFHEPVLWTSHAGPIDALATSPWAPLVAIAWQRQISFYDTNTHQLLGIIPYVDGVPRVVRFSRDGSLLLVAGGRHASAGSATLFDVKTGARITTLGDELDIVLAADISPDLSLVAIGGPKKKVRVYRVADGSLAYQLTKHTDWVTALGFSPDGRLLATADRNGGALLWQATAGHERADLRGHKGAISALDWRADAAMLATASEDGTVRLWNPGGQQIKSVAAHKGGVLSVRFAQDGNWVTAGRDHKVKAWKPDGGAIADLGKLSNLALAADFSHDGSKVIASDYAGEVRVIEVTSKKPIATLLANPPLLAHRLIAADSTLQEAQHKVEASQTQLQAKLAAWELGKAAHATHESKLAAAQTTHQTEQKKYHELTQAHTKQQQTLVAARQAVGPAKLQLAASQTLLEQAQAELSEATNEPSVAEQLATLAAVVDQALEVDQRAQQQAEKALSDSRATDKKRQAAEKRIQAAEAAVAQVADETAGLPDLTKLIEQHDQAQAGVELAQQQLQQVQENKAFVVAQQTRFAKALEQFTDEVQQRRTQQQELAKQLGRLEAEHQQAAEERAKQRAKLAKMTRQLKSLQKKIDSLQVSAAASKDLENQLATQLAEIQTALSRTQQQVGQIETQKQDFRAAEELRKIYVAE